MANYDFLKQLANYMFSRKGLYGLFSNPGFGKTTLMIHLIHKFSGFGEKCLLFSLELSKQQVLDRMNRFKLSPDGLMVLDSPLCNFETIAKKTQMEKPQCVFIDYLQLVDGNKCDLIKDLKEITEQLSVPIFFTGTLPRESGDYDLFNRPELYDLTYLFPPNTSLSNARHTLEKMDLIMFLHRHHDCDRNIGTANRYNISNRAELIIKQRFVSDLPVSFHFDFTKMID